MGLRDKMMKLIKKTGLFDWLIDVLQKSEKDVEFCAGIEILLYLTFLKWTAQMFLGIFILGGIPLLILYYRMYKDIDQELDFIKPSEKFTIKAYEGV